MMQERITNKRKQVVFLLVLCLSLVFGCTKKQEAVKEPEINPEDYLKVSFTEIVDNYFFNDDIDGLQQCIGKIVTSEEIDQVYKKYSPGGYPSGSSINYPFDFDNLDSKSVASKRLMYTYKRIRRKDGEIDYKIFDINHLESSIGNRVGLFPISKDASDGGFPIRLPFDMGIVEYKANTGKFPIPLGKKIIPDWIVSVNEEGKIIITKPVDGTMFIYIPDEPE